MRRLIATLLIIFWPGVFLGQRSIFFSQNTLLGNVITYVTGCGATIPCSVTVSAGQLIIINGVNNTVDTPTITDSTGNTPVALSGYPVTYNAGEATDWIWIIKNATAGTHSINITWSGGGHFPAMVVGVLNGASISSPIDSTNSLLLTYSNTAPNVCGNVTTTIPKEFLFSFSTVANGGITYSPGLSPQAMTLGENDGTGSASEYGIAPLAGVTHVEWFTPTNTEVGVCDTLVIH